MNILVTTFSAELSAESGAESKSGVESEIGAAVESENKAKEAEMQHI